MSSWKLQEKNCGIRRWKTLKDSFICTFKLLIRDKVQLFWNLLFPLLLGTMFYVAFSGLSDAERFQTIPVAVVLDETASTGAFKDTIDSLSKTGENRFLEVTYASEEKALSLLEQKKVIGILYEGSPVTLSVSAQMSDNKLEQSILNSFVNQYNLNVAALTAIATEHPKNFPAALGTLSAATNYNTETTFSSGTMDESLTFFFNLIAMTCLYSYMSGIKIALYNQANLSPLGARKCLAPTHKLLSLISELFAAFLYQFGCILISLFYLIFVLKVNFGAESSYVFLAALMGCMVGVSMGFFIGSIGRMSADLKFGILMAVSMICCFFSGLMAGNMRILVEQYCPWFNRINPAALISDSFYSLTVYQSHHRYFLNLGTLLLLSALFYFGGFLMIRRKKYAAL